MTMMMTGARARAWAGRARAGTALLLLLAGVGLPAVAAAQATPVTEADAAATPVAGAIEARVIGTTSFPSDLEFEGTLVGGLSGLDYDPAADRWIALSDDRSDNAPARFYDLRVSYDAEAFGGVEFAAAATLLQGNGEPYPNREQGGAVPDPEAIRFDPATEALWFTSEGSRELGIDPFVAANDANGHLIAAPPLPERFRMNPDEEVGPRENLVFEGLTFAADGASLWLVMEGPLFEDGPEATVEQGPTVRLSNLDRSGNVLAEHAYPVDPIPVAPAGFGTSGVTEVLAVDGDRFLVVERASAEDAEGIFTNYVRLYEADLGGATDVRDVASLAEGGFTPVAKRLVLDLNAAGIGAIDNIEGIAWGPDLANGNRSLLLVSDNNFNETQVTQFIALEVLP
jgi:hypothetical protein